MKLNYCTPFLAKNILKIVLCDIKQPGCSDFAKKFLITQSFSHGKSKNHVWLKVFVTHDIYKTPSSCQLSFYLC